MSHPAATIGAVGSKRSRPRDALGRGAIPASSKATVDMILPSNKGSCIDEARSDFTLGKAATSAAKRARVADSDHGDDGNGAESTASASASMLAFPPLPPPLAFTAVALGCETWVAAELPAAPAASAGADAAGAGAAEAEPPSVRGVTAPVYLSKEQHRQLVRFICQEPCRSSRLLMPVGTIKSGKSTLVHRVLPGMLAAAHSDAALWHPERKRPVPFAFTFRLHRGAESGAKDLQSALAAFAKVLNLPFRCNEADTGSLALDLLPSRLFDFAQCVHDGGGELWLLLDELQAPVLASDHAMARNFTEMFKEVSKPILSAHTT